MTPEYCDVANAPEYSAQRNQINQRILNNSVL